MLGIVIFYTDSITHVSKLLRQKRIDYFLPADYRENSPLDKVIKSILVKIKSTEDLNRLEESQKNYLQIVQEMEAFVRKVTNFLQNIAVEKESLDKLKGYVLNYFDKSLENLEMKRGDLPQQVMLEMIQNNKENLLQQIENRR